MIRQNTSGYALRLNVSNARRGLLFHWINSLRERTSVVCTAILLIKQTARRYSLIWLRKPFIGEHTERKICSQKTSQSVRKVRANDPPTEESIGWSLLGYNAKFDCYHQRGTQC